MAAIKGVAARPLTVVDLRKLNTAARPHHDFFNFFKPGKLIGQGTICEGVYQCTNRLSEENFAVKILDRKLLKKEDQ